MSLKGKFGDAHPRTKVSDARCREMLEELEGGATVADCVAKYELTGEQISRIRSGRSRPHLQPLRASVAD